MPSLFYTLFTIAKSKSVRFLRSEQAFAVHDVLSSYPGLFRHTEFRVITCSAAILTERESTPQLFPHLMSIVNCGSIRLHCHSPTIERRCAPKGARDDLLRASTRASFGADPSELVGAQLGVEDALLRSDQRLGASA